MADSDWKDRLQIPINYSPGQTSDEEDTFELALDNDTNTTSSSNNNTRAASNLLSLEDNEVSPADLLGTTPPRTRIRNKEKRRSHYDCPTKLNRFMRRNTVDSVVYNGLEKASDIVDNLRRKRCSLKFTRNKDRDLKLDIPNEGHRGYRAESLPSPNMDAPYRKPVFGTLVESCNRFMSLSSKLKCSSLKSAGLSCPAAGKRECEENPDEGIPANRVDFHNTFSMLIKMGNDKNCRRTISMEEQVWQNELKDLIWLELQARLSSRTVQQEDEFLCEQRTIVPTIIQNIIDYRFVNNNPCDGRQRKDSVASASEGYVSSDETSSATTKITAAVNYDKMNTIDKKNVDPVTEPNEVLTWPLGCLLVDCDRCSQKVDTALREVGTLLDSFYNAETLYPSSKAMAARYPLVSTQLFNNRLKAMCLWYNMVNNLRLKLVIMRKFHRILETSWKGHLRQRSRVDQRCSSEAPSLASNKSDSQPTTPVVKFDGVSDNPSDSSNSDSSVEQRSKDELDDISPTGEIQSQSQRKFSTIPEDSNDSFNTAGTNDSDFGTSNDPGTEDHSNFYNRCHSGCDVSNYGPMSELTKMRLFGTTNDSPYRLFIQEELKIRGLRKSILFFDKMHRSVLKRTHMTFERYDDTKEYLPTDTQDELNHRLQEQTGQYSAFPENLEDNKDNAELRRYGAWSEEALQMCLPSYRTGFLILSSVGLEFIHEFLQMRLDTKPDKPSVLSVKQLIHEVKEGLDIASKQRRRFVRNVDAALAVYDVNGAAQNYFARAIAMFDSTLEKVFKQYLWYLSAWSDMEQVCRATLEEEWKFVAQLARSMRCVPLLAPNTFADIAAHQLQMVMSSFNNRFLSLGKNVADYPGCSSDDDGNNIAREGNQRLYYGLCLCREAQSIFSSEREFTIQTVQFIRVFSARLRRTSSFASCRTKLYKAMMEARDVICGQIESATIQTNRENIMKYQNVEEDAEMFYIFTRTREVLLQGYKFGFEFHRELHKLINEPLLTDKFVQSTGVQLRRVAITDLQRTGRYDRKRLGTILLDGKSPGMFRGSNPFHRELHRYVNDQSFYKSPKPSVNTSRNRTVCLASGVSGRRKLTRSDSIGGSSFDKSVFADTDPHFPVCSIDFSPMVASLDGGAEENGGKSQACEERLWAETVSLRMIDFAKCWMKFVMDRCDRGRGLRPRWANHGLEFLILACDPSNTKHLSEEEFDELKKTMDACISHVIGEPPVGASATPCSATPPPQRRQRPPLSYLQPQSPQPQLVFRPQPSLKEVPSPPCLPNSPNPLVAFHNQLNIHQQRVSEAVNELEQRRDAELQSRGVVGRALEGAAVYTPEHKPRQVTFPWQRGIKIGAGRFGKVYTVVNTKSGQLLAMKEVSLGPGDRLAVQKAANELKVLEGVLHPHLVRYYGCEIHREEMLLFMELCVEGSLAGLLAAVGALPELQVRRYAKQLVGAVQELHARHIAHRDIKSANIFLTNSGNHLKLGDFGCAVRIRANTTAVGELQGYVGTQAYMAPEVFTKAGHGRAADIWSLGCVVTEMATGKRPFSEYDSNYHIMFLVGTGRHPDIPATLSAEGQDFCSRCFTRDEVERPRASLLATHHFLMVKNEDGCEDFETNFMVGKPLEELTLEG